MIDLWGWPEVEPTEVKLRPYQREAVEAIKTDFKNVNSTLLILPTGTGKTVTFGWMAREYAEERRRTLILAHRGELIEQAVTKLSHLGVRTEIEMAKDDAFTRDECHAVVASVQTLKGKRLTRWPKDHFDLIITDEAHHATAASYLRIYDHFAKAKHLGVTATADRSDKTNLGEVFDSIAYELGLWDAIKYRNPETGATEQVLSPLRFVQCEVGVDLRDIRTIGGDFSQDELEERIAPYIEVFANVVKKEIADRPTIVFTPCIGSAQAMSSALNSIDIKAEWISGADVDRKDKLDKYQSGKIQVLCNCALLTEGFDAPRTAAIVLMRPTKSRSLYTQMVGRGTRLFEGKENCLVIDFDWLTKKHDLVKPIDLIRSNKPAKEGRDRVDELVDELMTSHEQIDLEEAIEKATKQANEERDEEIRQKQERERIKVEAREKNLAYRKTVVDPLSLEEWLGAEPARERYTVVYPATQSQLDLLKKFGLEVPVGISKGQAGKLIDAAIRRRNAGMATYKQMKAIHKWAPELSQEEIRSLKFDQASEILSGLATRHGWNQR